MLLLYTTNSKLYYNSEFWYMLHKLHSQNSTQSTAFVLLQHNDHNDDWYTVSQQSGPITIAIMIN